MAKRLTLTEYRQENALWLSNNLQGGCLENFIFEMYLRYLYAYGFSPNIIYIIDKMSIKFYDVKYSIMNITSEQLEQIIAENISTDEVEHCPH